MELEGLSNKIKSIKNLDIFDRTEYDTYWFLDHV